MTFEQACELIRDLVIARNYKVITRYKSNQTFTFKFERGPNQYDAIDILYMHLSGESKPKDVHHMYMKIDLLTEDSIALINLASRGWKFHCDILKDSRYDYYRHTFQSITGIPIN